MIVFHCARCGQKITAPVEYAGKSGRCTKCGLPAVIPTPPPKAQAAPQTTPKPEPQPREPTGAIDRQFDPPYEKSRVRIFQNWVEVAGTHYRLPNALNFAAGREHALELRAEPDNDHDPNAVKVIGGYRGLLFPSRREHIGYLPREVAALVASMDLGHEVWPRLRKIWVSFDKDKCSVILDLMTAR